MTGLEQLIHAPAFAKAARARARDLLDYVDESPTPYHAVEATKRRLHSYGYSALSEDQAWKLSPGDRRYVQRNGSTIVAFVVGQRSPAEGGFLIVGAHTDSPNLKIKPRSGYEKNGYAQLGVEVYGGVLLSTWLDRDLSVAGRVAVRTPNGVDLRLIDFRRPLLRVPNLAIHLNRDVNKAGLKLNKQTHMAPIIGIGFGEEEDGFRALLAREMQVEPDTILDHDLSLYDVQKGAFSGADEEFIHVARLDNLASCHAGLTALEATQSNATDATRVLAFYDHEEVGSRSAQGAAGPFLASVLERVAEHHDEALEQATPRAIARSFLVSADMAHAVHPNYPDKHEPRHMPMIGQGPVIKTNANQSYATDAESAGRFAALCQEAGFAPQNFVTRTDLACGSTIGPITAARIGVKTVDVGNPMLSMHSVREMAGTFDVELMHRALCQHFKADG